MDLSKLSDQDFAALRTGDLTKMSDAGFAMFLKAQDAAVPREERQQRTMARSAEEASPIKGMSGLDLLAAGAGKAVSDVGTALMQAIPGSSVDRASVDKKQQLDAPLMSTGLGKTGYVLGTGATAAPLMLAPGANTVLGAAALGGVSGAATPLGTNDSLVKNVLYGAAGGAGALGTAKGLSAVMAPNPSASAKTLMDAGITLTPGQRLGGGWKRAEDAMTSMPVTGDLIRSAQRRTFEDFGAAVANKALAPIGDKLPAGLTGREAVAYTERAIGNAYESVLSRIKNVTADPAFDAELKSLKNMVATSPMPPEVKSQFANIVRNQITGKLQGQSSMTAQTFKDAESELGRLASRFGADPSADKQLLGDAIQEAQASLRRLLERSAGPDFAGDVKAANQGWAEFKRMQRAASMLGAKEGVFSPENYMNAVKALDKSKDKGAFSRGSALGQSFAEDALRVMGATVPDSGTPFRSLVTRPIEGLLSATLSFPAALPYLGSRAQSLSQGLLSSQRPMLMRDIAAELEMAAPALGVLGISGANAYQRVPR